MDIEFEKDDTPWGFTPHDYECPFCGGQRVVHRSKIDQPYAITENKVCHITFKCVQCYATSTHGIPISDEYAEELIDRREGNSIYVPWSDKYPGEQENYLGNFSPEEEEVIKDRLKDLGYF